MKKLTKLFVSLFVLLALVFTVPACAKKVTVTFDANGGIVSPITCKYQINESYTLPTPIRQGYTFVKWQHGDKDVSMEGIWVIDKEAVLKAVWEAKTYSVLLKYTDDEGEKTQNVQVIYGEQVELLKPTKNGYVFTGWYYGNKLVSDGLWQIDGENIVLEAKWASESMTITFDLNGGSFSDKYKNLKQMVLKYGQEYDFTLYGAHNRVGETYPTWKVNGKKIEEKGIWLFTEDVTVEAIWPDPSEDYFPAH